MNIPLIVYLVGVVISSTIAIFYSAYREKRFLYAVGFVIWFGLIWPLFVAAAIFDWVDPGCLEDYFPKGGR